jgi:hypothetical protein
MQHPHHRQQQQQCNQMLRCEPKVAAAQVKLMQRSQALPAYPMQHQQVMVQHHWQ